MGLYLQSQVKVINTPISDDPSPVPFSVEIGETAVSVANRLYEQSLVSDPDIFRRFLSYNGLDSSLEEAAIALGHISKSEDPRKAYEDIVWALINTKEFLFNH